MERIKSADKFAASSEARQFDPFFNKKGVMRSIDR
jgi:hypothetical protein